MQQCTKQCRRAQRQKQKCHDQPTQCHDSVKNTRKTATNGRLTPRCGHLPRFLTSREYDGRPLGTMLACHSDVACRWDHGNPFLLATFSHGERLAPVDFSPKKKRRLESLALFEQQCPKRPSKSLWKCRGPEREEDHIICVEFLLAEQRTRMQHEQCQLMSFSQCLFGIPV